VKISEREVQKLYERYALFLRSDVKEAVKDALNQVGIHFLCPFRPGGEFF